MPYVNVRRVFRIDPLQTAAEWRQGGLMNAVAEETRKGQDHGRDDHCESRVKVPFNNDSTLVPHSPYGRSFRMRPG